MPQIREYTAQGVSLNPDERGMAALGRTAGALGSEAGAAASLADSAAGTGRANAAGLAGFGEGLGQGIASAGQAYVKWQTNKEVSRGAAALAALTADLTDNWNQAASAADPNDTSIGPAFHEKTLEPALAKYVEAFTTEEGQEWARSQANQMRGHFTDKVQADSSARAGLAVAQNLDTLGSRVQDMVHRDPTSLPAAMTLLQNGVGTMVATNPNLSAVEATRVRTALLSKLEGDTVKTAVIGIIDLNPEEGLKRLNAGQYADHIDNDTAQQLRAYADRAIKDRDTQGRLDAAEQARAAKAAAEADAAAIQASVIQPDGSIKAGPEFMMAVRQYQIKHGSNANVDTMIRFGDWAATQAAEQEGKTDPHTYADFAGRANLPDGDPKALTMQQVLDARMSGTLSKTEFRHFADILGKPASEKAENRELSDFVNSFKSAITNSNPLLGTINPVGDQYFMQFEINARRVFDDFKKRGKTPQDAYNAIRGSIPAFVPSKQRMTRDAAVAVNILPDSGIIVPKGLLPGGTPHATAEGVPLNAPPAAAADATRRMPGESPAAFLARTKGN